MNSHRLASVVELISGELLTVKTVKRVAQLVSSLQAAINGPTEATQRSVEESRSTLTSALEEALSNDLSPGIREEVDELLVGETPVSELLGLGLLKRLNAALEVGYTSVKALDEVQEISSEVSALQQAIEFARQGLDQLGVRADDLDPGESIVGMTIPRTEVAGVNDLRKELHVFGLFVTQLAEAIHGQHQEPKVRTLRSSGFGIDLGADLDVVAAFAMAVKGIKLALDKLKRFRGLKTQMEELQIDPKTVSAIETQSEKSMSNDLDALEVEIANEFKFDSEGRPTELRTAVRISLNRIANRMERGFIFEARTQVPENATEKELANVGIVEALSSVRFESIEGPRLLELPEGELEAAHADGKTAEPSVVRPKKKKSSAPKTEA